MDTEVQAPEHTVAEDEAVWSRAWEWPGWIRALGRPGGLLRRAAGWRPEPRTLAVVMALFSVEPIVDEIPEAKPAWEALLHSGGSEFGLRGWEVTYAAALLADMAGAVLLILAAAVLLVAPRRLPGYLVAVLGLLLSSAAAVALYETTQHVIFLSNLPGLPLIVRGAVPLVLLAVVMRTAWVRRRDA